MPQLRGQMGNAKSYAERLFDFTAVRPLASDAAMLAIEKPLPDEKVAITPDSMNMILEVTQGYAYFLQE